MAKSLKAIKSLDPGDFRSMTKAEIREYLKPAAKLVSERMERFEKQGISTPASRYMEGRGRIKISGTRSQMIRELSDARRFLTSKTSTVAGAKSYIRETRDRLGIKGKRLSKAELNTIWDLISQVEECCRGIGSDEVQKIVAARFVENRNKKISISEKRNLLEEMSQNPRFKTMVQDIRAEEMTNEKYTLYHSMLDLQRRYEQQQAASAPKFFRTNR